MRRLALSLLLSMVSACAVEVVTTPVSQAPLSLQVGPPLLVPPELGLPFHAAAIVDVALLPPQAGEQWRLASGDADGWVRIWADGKLLAVHHAHPGGLMVLQLAADGRWYTAGADGRVLEWRADSLAPTRSLTLGKPISAFAVIGPQLAISDGRYVQLWSRDDAEPRLLASLLAHGFVTSLAFSPRGERVIAAELRPWALEQGVATHPLAPDPEKPELDAAEARAKAASQRQAAARDFPGAAADFIEVWESGRARPIQMAPRAPIDNDVAVLGDGTVVMREIYSRDEAGLIGRRIADDQIVPLKLLKPWAFWTKANGEPTEASLAQNLPVADFRMAADDQLAVLDQFPGWGSTPLERGWRAGDRRELATDLHHAAIGDGQGNLAVVAWVRPSEAGWQAPALQQLDALAGAAAAAQIVTATLEPRTGYRLWSLDRGEQRLIRVEAPWQVIPDDDSRQLYPSALALDNQGKWLATSMSSYAGDGQGAVRVLAVDKGIAQILGLSTSDVDLDIGISHDGRYLLAWAPGAATHTWQIADGTWIAGPDALVGVPRFSPNGRWSGHASSVERHIVDLVARKPVHASRHESGASAAGAGTLAAIADDGTLAVVSPFGGGTLELLGVEREPVELELPGAATALTWVDRGSEGTPVLVVGFADGTIARVDAGMVVPIDPGVGGRVWALASFGRPGVFAELDERGLSLHRLSDSATLDLYLADPSLLMRSEASPPQPSSSAGLVAVWRPGAGMRPLVVFDGTGLGVLAHDDVQRWGADRVASLFELFLTASSPPSAEPEPAPEPSSDSLPSEAPESATKG